MLIKGLKLKCLTI